MPPYRRPEITTFWRHYVDAKSGGLDSFAPGVGYEGHKGDTEASCTKPASPCRRAKY
jgi:hypothetical protein